MLPPKLVAPSAAAAEQAGVDAVSVNETARDSIVAGTIAIGATSTIEVSTSVTMAFPRSPTITAMTAWDMQEYARGRFVLGLGPQVRGHIQRRFGMTWSPPVPRMRDYVGALRALWTSFQTGAQLTYESNNYRLTLLTKDFNPGPIGYPPPKIHLAGVNPAMCRLAGEVADGLRVHPLMTPKYLAEVAIPAVQEGATRAGRNPADVDVVAVTFMAVGDSDEALSRERNEIRRTIAFYGSTRSYHPVLAVHGLQDLGEKLNRMVGAGQWDTIAAEISDDVVDIFSIVCPLDTVAAEVRRRYAGLVSRFAFMFLPNNVLKDPERLGEIVRQTRNPSPAAYQPRIAG